MQPLVLLSRVHFQLTGADRTQHTQRFHSNCSEPHNTHCPTVTLKQVLPDGHSRTRNHKQLFTSPSPHDHRFQLHIYLNAVTFQVIGVNCARSSNVLTSLCNHHPPDHALFTESNTSICSLCTSRHSPPEPNEPVLPTRTNRSIFVPSFTSCLDFGNFFRVRCSSQPAVLNFVRASIYTHEHL